MLWFFVIVFRPRGLMLIHPSSVPQQPCSTIGDLSPRPPAIVNRGMPYLNKKQKQNIGSCLIMISSRCDTLKMLVVVV